MTTSESDKDKIIQPSDTRRQASFAKPNYATTSSGYDGLVYSVITTAIKNTQAQRKKEIINQKRLMIND